MEFGVTPYRAKAIEVITNTGGQSVSTHGGTGLFGGYPSPTARFLIARKTDVGQQFADRIVPEHIDALKAEERLLLRGKSNGAPLVSGDVLETTFTGGGGYGDPLEREPERVAHDVEMGYVSADAARSLYAVALADDGSVDTGETEKLRKAELDTRGGWEPAGSAELTSDATGEPERVVHEYLVAKDADGKRVLACSRCGHVVSDYRANYKTGLLTDTQPVTVIPHVIDPSYFLDDQMLLRRFCCPGCRVQMSVEVARDDEELFSEFKFA
jgi:N-methylhydantoinase B